MKQLKDKVNLGVRKCQIGERHITAAQERDSNYLEDIVKKDQAYYIFKQCEIHHHILKQDKKMFFYDSTLRIAYMFHVIIISRYKMG